MTINKKVLPSYTEFTSRSSFASIFIKIGSKNIINHFVCHALSNLYFDSTYLEIVGQHTFYGIEELFETHYESFHTHILEKRRDDYLCFIQKKLSENYYFTSYHDEFFVEGSPCYKSNHHDKEHTVYGFNNNEKVFYVISFGETRMQEYEVPFEKYLDSLYSFQGDYIYYSYSKLKPRNCYPFNKEFIVRNLEDYISSRNRFWVVNPSNISFGFQAIRDYYSYINELIKEQLPAQINDSMLLLDHKKMFSKSLNYLEKAGMITPEKWSERYSDIIKIAARHLDLLKEYNDSFKTGDKRRTVLLSANEMIAAEEIIIRELINRGLTYGRR